MVLSRLCVGDLKEGINDPRIPLQILDRSDKWCNASGPHYRQLVNLRSFHVDGTIIVTLRIRSCVLTS